MAQFPQISKRSLDGAYKPMPIKYFHSVSLAEGETEMTIPLKLVRMADQSHPAIIAYLHEKYPIIFQEPVDVPAEHIAEERIPETEPVNVEEAPATVQEAEIETEPEVGREETGAESPDVGGEESFHSMPGESGDYDSDDQSPPPLPSPVAKRKKSLARKKDTPEKRRRMAEAETTESVATETPAATKFVSEVVLVEDITLEEEEEEAHTTATPMEFAPHSPIMSTPEFVVTTGEATTAKATVPMPKAMPSVSSVFDSLRRSFLTTATTTTTKPVPPSGLNETLTNLVKQFKKQ